tara:strand:+ start:1608 stop:2168 length:561 start_codon:yes stop_codon:yes gene_type:complete
VSSGIGCDVIHLPDHWKVDTLAPRRIQKLYTSRELTLMNRIDSSEKVAEAIMWSAKESTYKACHEGPAAFNPKSYCITGVKDGELFVKYQERHYTVWFRLDKEVVFTELRTEKSKGYHSQLEWVEGNESESLRTKVSSYLSDTYGGSWSIQKTEYGKPMLFQDNRLSTKKLSLSHHQGYIAFVLCN